MSVLSEFSMGENCIRENYDMNLALNELASLQNELPTIKSPFIYEAEMLPVFEILDENGDSIYCVEADQFKKLVTSKDIPISDGIEQLFNSVKNQCDDCMKEQIAIVFHHENVEAIDNIVRSDPSKFEARCESVIHRTNIIKAIIEEGAKVLFV